MRDIESLFEKEIISFSEEDTFSAGLNLSNRMRGGELIGIEGDLGAGKTIFVKGLAAGLSVDWKADVDSPTFKIINTYSGRYVFHHIDLYRLSSVEDIIGIGLFDLFDPGSVICIEWAERLNPLNISFNYYIKIDITNNETRKIHIR